MMEPTEPKYSFKEYVSTLLLYSGGKTYIPEATQTMYLQAVTNNSSPQTVPEYVVSIRYPLSTFMILDANLHLGWNYQRFSIMQSGVQSLV